MTATSDEQEPDPPEPLSAEEADEAYAKLLERAEAEGGVPDDGDVEPGELS